MARRDSGSQRTFLGMCDLVMTISGSADGARTLEMVLGIICGCLPCLVWPLRMRIPNSLHEIDGDKITQPGSRNEHGSGIREIDGEPWLGLEIDGLQLPGRELQGCQDYATELADNPHRYELEGSVPDPPKMARRNSSKTRISENDENPQKGTLLA